MNFFQKKTTWTNLELIPLKLSIASFYLGLGIYFHEALSEYITHLLLVFVISVSIALYLWLKKMKHENQ